MKVLAILLFCGVALAAAKPSLIISEAAAACAQEDSEGVLVAHENCNRFYKCNGGRPVALDCPAGLVYNIDEQYCDWAINVECGVRTIAEIPESNGNGNEDENENGNDYENVGAWIPEHGYDDPNQASSICAAKDSDGILVAHENCNQFYKCDQRVPVTLDCPASLLYQPKLEICDWPQNVKCGGRVIPDPAEKDDAQVEDKIIVDQLVAIPSDADIACSRDDSEGMLVAHENCNRFYKCNGGKPVALDCPAGLVYNIKEQYCDWAYNVECGERTIAEIPEGNGNGNEIGNENGNENGNVWVPENGHSDPSKAPEICAAKESDGVLVAHENCNQFYKCSEGVPVTLNCPASLLYHPEIESCDWPQNVECGERTITAIPEGNGNGNESGNENSNENGNVWVPENCHSDPSKAPEICAAKGSDGVLVAHENCNQFYKCSEGVPATLDCPASLLYHPEIEACDWPQNVDCSGRSKIIFVNK